MLSNSCRYGIRAIIYIASCSEVSSKTGIKKIAESLELPTPFLAKILQQLVKQKILVSLKGPHGGFSLQKDPKKITLYDIILSIDGDDIFTNCIMHNGTCKSMSKERAYCTLHYEYSKVRSELRELFRSRTIYDLVQKAGDTEKVFI